MLKDRARQTDRKGQVYPTDLKDQVHPMDQKGQAYRMDLPQEREALVALVAQVSSPRVAVVSQPRPAVSETTRQSNRLREWR